MSKGEAASKKKKKKNSKKKTECYLALLRTNNKQVSAFWLNLSEISKMYYFSNKFSKSTSAGGSPPLKLRFW